MTTYAYDDAGRLTSTTYPTGVVGTNGYNNADRLTSVTNANGGGTFSSFTYTLDAAGNRTQAVVTGGGAGTHSYTLDSLYRLTSVTYPDPTTDTYTYDALGNRLTKNAVSYTYDNADEMTAVGGVTYTYDANGNQTARGTDTFAWDHESRMTQSVVGGVTSSSVYYGNGVRRSHTVNGTTTTFGIDRIPSLPARGRRTITRSRCIRTRPQTCEHGEGGSVPDAYPTFAPPSACQRSSATVRGGSGLLMRTMKTGQGAVINTFKATLPRT